MNDYLQKVDWSRLGHAYGDATNVPQILKNMVSSDSSIAEQGWDEFWGAVNHQGDFYDSTVATIPFLIDQLLEDSAHQKIEIIRYFKSRWHDAAEYGGDPLTEIPPGGVDEPTPMVDADPSAANDLADEIAEQRYRPMELCAWQTGRAILNGRAYYQRLLNSNDILLASAATDLLMLWQDTRPFAKQRMAQFVDDESEPGKKVQMILQYAVFGDEGDLDLLQGWSNDSSQTVQLAAILGMAWILNPGPLPKSLLDKALVLAKPESTTFAELPWEGVFERGPWLLPMALREIVFPLSENHQDELRWRSTQAFCSSVSHFSRELDPVRSVQALLKRLDDSKTNIRQAAASGLGQRAEIVCQQEQAVEKLLVKLKEDKDATVCGQVARILILNRQILHDSNRLFELQRNLKSAVRRFRWSKDYVSFGNMGIAANGYFKAQLEKLELPTEPTLPQLFESYFNWFGEETELSIAQASRVMTRRFNETESQVFDEARRLLVAFTENSKRQLDPVVDGVRVRNAAVGVIRWMSTIGRQREQLVDELKGVAKNSEDSWAQSLAEDVLSEIASASQLTVVDAIQPLIDPATDDDELWEESRNLCLVPVGVEAEYQNNGVTVMYRKIYQCRAYEATKIILSRDDSSRPTELINTMIKLVCKTEQQVGADARSFCFSDHEWKSAIEAAGGFAAVESAIRAARQREMSHRWTAKINDADLTEENSPNPGIGMSELSKVLDFYSGRVFPVLSY